MIDHQTIVTLRHNILPMTLHLTDFLLQAFVLHLTHNGVQLFQTLRLRVVGDLDLRTFYFLLKLLVILCLAHSFTRQLSQCKTRL